jgi:iron complex outermembrane recepter protein
MVASTEKRVTDIWRCFMKRSRLTALMFAILIILPGGFVQARGAELAGFVNGPKDTGLFGAKVTLRRLDSDALITVIAGTRGAYQAHDLAGGKYEVKVELAGFEPRIITEVALGPDESKTLNFDLAIHGLHEMVTVIGPAPGDSLEAAEARASSARDVGEALALSNGVWKLRKGGIASDVVLRGFQSRDLNVLIDGQRIYGACPNHMDPPAFHADFGEVDRVELGKGPFDVRNQGSLGGVINIVTRRPEPGWHAGADFSTGSYGYINPVATASYGTARFSVLGGYSYRRSDPYTDGAGKRFTEGVNYLPAALDSDAFRAGTAWGKFSVTPGTHQSLQVSYARQQADHVLYPYLQMDAAYDNADRVNLAYQTESAQSFFRALRVHGYLTKVDHWMTDQYRTSGLGVARAYSMGTMAKTATFGGRFEAETRLFTVGLETFRRVWDATTVMAGSGYQTQYSIPDVHTDSIGLYAMVNRKLTEAITLDAGTRVDVSRSAADPAKANTGLAFAYNSTRSTSSTDAMPSGNVRVSYRASHGLDISLGGGSTTRMPEPQERYIALKRMGSDWVGNPLLAPSRNTGVDGTLSYRHRGMFLGSSLYFNRVDDFITVNRQPKVNMVAGVMNSFARSYQNVLADIYGADMQTVIGITRQVFFSGNVSYVRGTQETDPAHGILSTHLPEMPPLSSRTALQFLTPRFSAELEGVFSGPQRSVDTDLREDPTPGYGTANLKLSATFRRFMLRATFSNLLDRRYYEYMSYQRDPFRTGARVFEPGRNVFLNLSFRY